MKMGLLVVMLAFTAACSTTPTSKEKAAQTDDPEKGIICTYEKPTGSFLKEKRCTTPGEREAARRQEAMLDVRSGRDSGL